MYLLLLIFVISRLNNSNTPLLLKLSVHCLSLPFRNIKNVTQVLMKSYEENGDALVLFQLSCVNGLIKRHIFNYADCTPHLPDYDPNSVRNLIVCSPNQIIQLLTNIHDTEEVNVEYTGDTLKIGSFYGRLDSIQGILYP